MVRSLALALAFALGAPAFAEEAGFGLVGFGWIGSNDAYGDRDDRWRSAALTTSFVFGPKGQTQAPHRFGEMWELRGRGEVISPADLDNPAADDRAYAAVLAFGAHTHATRGRTDLRLGAELVFIGPQTGLDDLQKTLHARIPGQPSPEVAQRTQIDNTTRLSLSGEVAHAVPLGAWGRLRPFAEARTGDETFARIGADLIVGRFGESALTLRDTVTGQLYQGTRGTGDGLSFLVGADVAAMGESVYFPENRRAELERVRSRARLGAHWQRGRFSVQYGFTYLAPEFDTQPEGQVLGSASIRYRF